MLENLYTTKMSMDKEKVQSRFEKIRSKNGKWSKTVSVIIFVIVMIIIGTISVYLAVKQSNENPYAMSEADFREYTSRPIGALMADIDYADDEKVVFHYTNGFFVTNEKTKEIKHKIDLSKLNSALPVQADTTLMIRIDKNGDKAFLESQGVMSEAEKFDKYIIDLNTGEVEIGEMPENTELFGGYIDTYEIDSIGGWSSNRAVRNNNMTYYLTLPYGEVGNIYLVKTSSGKNEEADWRYIFGDEYISAAAKREQIIHNALPDDYKIYTNSGMSWTVDGETVKEIIRTLEPGIKQEIVNTFSDDSYEVVIYKLYDKKENGLDGLFIFDKTDGRLMYHLTDPNLESNVFPLISGYFYKIDKEFEMSDLYGALGFTLVVGGKRYAPINDEAGLDIEKMLSEAKPMKGGSKCPFKVKLVIDNKDKKTSMIELAADSCAVFRDGDKYYDYSDGDNAKFYSLFGIDSRDFPDLFIVK